jgi:hypothetical protein
MKCELYLFCRIQKIPSELSSFEDDLDTLLGEIADLIGKDPMDIGSLVPPSHEIEYAKILEDMSKTAANYLEMEKKPCVFNIPMNTSDGTQVSYEIKRSQDNGNKFSATICSSVDRTISEREEDEIESMDNMWYAHRHSLVLYFVTQFCY